MYQFFIISKTDFAPQRIIFIRHPQMTLHTGAPSGYIVKSCYRKLYKQNFFPNCATFYSEILNFEPHKRNVSIVCA